MPWRYRPELEIGAGRARRLPTNSNRMSDHRHEHPERTADILDILRKMRNSPELSREEIDHFVRGNTQGQIADPQGGCMADASAGTRPLPRGDRVPHGGNAALGRADRAQFTGPSARP